MKRLLISLMVVSLALVQSCTNFQEEELPVALSVDTNSLAFSSGVSTRSTTGETRSLTVTSGSKWDVTSMPEWINLESIYRSGLSPYGWTVSFSANVNNEYNREGKIVVSSMTDRVEILASQEGPKGEYVAVESISLHSEEIIITEEQSTLLTYEITPSNASVKDVTWKSSNTSVATVSRSGQIDAIAEGTTLITATTVDGNKTATCAVKVNAKVISVTGVSLDKTSLTMTEGDTQTLTATVTPSNATDKSVTWSSSNSSVASVSSSGVVTAKASGSATITVTTNDGGKKATCSVIVIVPVTGVSLNQTSLSMGVGDTQTLTAIVSPSNATDKTVTWSSSNTSVATVSSAGVVTAKAAGSATVSVTTNDGTKKATCNVTVIVPVTGISLSQTSLSLEVGTTHTLTATVTPSNATDKTVTWSSSNDSVVTVSSTGVVTAKAVGEATITVETKDGDHTATCKARVYEVSYLNLTFNHLQLVDGMSFTMYASSTTTDIEWYSDNPSVASVSTSGVITDTSIKSIGVITTKSIGQATITVRAGNKEASCIVYVYHRDYRDFQAVDLDLPSGLKWATHNLGASKPEEYGDYFAWGETESKPFYDSSNYIYYDEARDHYHKYFPKYSQPYSSSPSLEPQDDAAHVKWGGSWKIPTWRDLDELIKTCYWEWTSVNGVEGYLVSSKTNGNSIFLPVGGEFAGASVHNVQLGYYWTSTANDNSWGSHQLVFGSSSYSRQFGNTWSMYGAAIRAVSY